VSIYKQLFIVFKDPLEDALWETVNIILNGGIL